MNDSDISPRERHEAFFLRGDPTPLGTLRSSCLLRDVRGLVPTSLRVYGAYALVLVMEGSGAYRDANGVSESLDPGDAVIVFPELPQTYGAVPGTLWTEFYVAFAGPVFDDLRRAGILDASRPVRRGVSKEAGRAILELARAHPSLSGTERTAEVARFYSLLVAVLTADGELPVRAWKERAAESLDRYATHPDYLEKAAARAGLAPESFRKRFTREQGKSPMAYVRQRRLEAAANLLRDTSMPLREVAEILAFSDEYHLSRRFHEAYGVAPSEYRRRVRLLTDPASELIH